jgi:hypothetical protein
LDSFFHTLICKLGQLSNDLPTLAKNRKYLCGLRNVDNEISTTQVAAATYLDDQNELNISSNVGNGMRCQIFEDSDCSDSATVEAELLDTKSGLIGTVLGHAVAWSSWGSLDVNVSVASKSTEDFTAYPERHPLIQNPCRSQYGAM